MSNSQRIRQVAFQKRKDDNLKLMEENARLRQELKDLRRKHYEQNTKNVKSDLKRRLSITHNDFLRQSLSGQPSLSTTVSMTQQDIDSMKDKHEKEIDGLKEEMKKLKIENILLSEDNDRLKLRHELNELQNSMTKKIRLPNNQSNNSNNSNHSHNHNHNRRNSNSNMSDDYTCDSVDEESKSEYSDIASITKISLETEHQASQMADLMEELKNRTNDFHKVNDILEENMNMRYLDSQSIRRQEARMIQRISDEVKSRHNRWIRKSNNKNFKYGGSSSSSDAYASISDMCELWQEETMSLVDNILKLIKREKKMVKTQTMLEHKIQTLQSLLETSQTRELRAKENEMNAKMHIDNQLMDELNGRTMDICNLNQTPRHKFGVILDGIDNRYNKNSNGFNENNEQWRDAVLHCLQRLSRNESAAYEARVNLTRMTDLMNKYKNEYNELYNLYHRQTSEIGTMTTQTESKASMSMPMSPQRACTQAPVAIDNTEESDKSAAQWWLDRNKQRREFIDRIETDGNTDRIMILYGFVLRHLSDDAANDDVLSLYIEVPKQDKHHILSILFDGVLLCHLVNKIEPNYAIDQRCVIKPDLDADTIVPLSDANVRENMQLVLSSMDSLDMPIDNGNDNNSSNVDVWFDENGMYSMLISIMTELMNYESINRTNSGNDRKSDNNSKVKPNVSNMNELKHNSEDSKDASNWNVKEELDKRQLQSWINSFLSNNLRVYDLYEGLSDGIIILKLMEMVKPGCVNWNDTRKSGKKRIRLKHEIKTVWDKRANCNYAMDTVCKNNFPLIYSKLQPKGIVFVDSVNSIDNQKEVKSFLWQLMRYDATRQLSELSKIIDKNRNNCNNSQPNIHKMIVHWANSKVNENENDHRIDNIESFKDPQLTSCQFYCQLLNAVAPKSMDMALVYTDLPVLRTGKRDEHMNERLDNASYTISMIRRLGGKIFVMPEDLVYIEPKAVLSVFAAIMKIDINLTTSM